MPHSPLRTAALIATTLGVLGCPNPSDPCDDDVFGCDDTPPGSIVFDDACALTGELRVVAGWGQDGFTDFSTPPVVHDGFQGGQHVFLAAHVDNADLPDHPVFELRFRLLETMSLERCAGAIAEAREWNESDLPESLARDPDAGAEPELPVFVQWGDDDPWLPIVGSSRCLRFGFERTILIGTPDPLPIDAEGRPEIYGVLVQVPYVEAPEQAVLVVEAIDQCRRTGFDVAAFPLEQ